MPAIPFRADVRESPRLATVALHGDIDLSAEAGLRAAYDEALALGAATILFDFADTAYINSTGIALLVRLLADARRDRLEVSARGLSPHYAGIFRITRLSDYVRIVDEPASATAAAPMAGRR